MALNKERFISLSTSTRSANDIVQITILEARFNLREALERYYKQESNDIDTTNDETIVKARTKALIFELKPILERQIKKDELKTELEKIDSKDFKQIISLIEYLNDFIYELGLTQIDVEKYDRRNPDEEDRVKGL